VDDKVGSPEARSKNAVNNRQLAVGKRKRKRQEERTQLTIGN